jgi:hypothetical protein
MEEEQMELADPAAGGGGGRGQLPPAKDGNRSRFAY